MHYHINHYSIRAAVLIFCIAFSASAHPFNYYVSQDGSDKNNGLSWRDAWRTLEYAGKYAHAGDTVIIRKGNEPYLHLPISNSGKAELPITFKGELESDPPVITSAVKETRWSPTDNKNVWSAPTTAEPLIVVVDNSARPKATSSACEDGAWFWSDNTFFYRPSSGVASNHVVWRASMGDGIQIGNHSWIIIENIRCHIGQGSCVTINKGQNNIVRKVQAKWYVRGIQIVGGSNNVIEDCIVEENLDGIYLLAGASNNTVRRCKALRNGNFPTWKTGDRAGIAIGIIGVNPGNKLVSNEAAFNGGPNSDPGLIAYQAPGTLISENYVHNNYGPGLMVTISSDDSVVINNRVMHNGRLGVDSGYKNISGLSVRRSRNVRVENNKIISNYVAADTWRGGGKIDVGPRGGLDLRGNKGDNMSGIKFINNLVCGTQNGPDIYISPTPNTSGFLLKEPIDMRTKCLNQQQKL